MINTNMRSYDYFTLDGKDDYGQPQLSEKKGTVKISINLNSQSAADNVKYRDATYVGLSLDKAIDDSYVIQYGNEKLKITFANPVGKYNQIYMSEMA